MIKDAKGRLKHKEKGKETKTIKNKVKKRRRDSSKLLAATEE